ncbi:replication endonuclease [Alteromonas oceani]|uniref:Replication endonuclease n=1 Tax=Alteromonas oceani TaxID=2071609 RepID=A0ABV7JVR6_9ALTE|nr:replication endonuclease [Alteromonas oceani]
MPPIAYDVAHKYLKISQQSSYIEANRFLARLDKELEVADLNLSKDIAELKNFSKQKALECMRDTAHMSTDVAFQFCISKFSRYGFTIPDDMSQTEALSLLRSDKFWFKKLKALSTQKMEEVRRQLDLVNQAKSTYCSQDRLRQHQWEKEQAHAFMENKWSCSADGEFISMLDAYNANVSNPKIRRAELMVRIKGTEEFSKLQGDCGWFYILTTPSKFHSHYKSGKANPKYQKLTVKDASDYLNSQWQKARAQFDREEINVYGLRVVEPHHDGTPHWHLMLFMPPERATRVTEILRHYAMEHDGEESGARESRFKAEEIREEKGSAQDYIAKYICKNIDGEYLDTDKYGNDAKVAASRIAAWASLYKIRQFQFIGLPSVSLWRQLRKVDGSIKDFELDQLRQAADSSDWLAYMLMMGGTNKRKVERPFALEYEKQVKAMFEDISPELLSKHAYNSKPKTILSVSARHPIANKGWTLFSSLDDLGGCMPAVYGSHAGSAASLSHRRFEAGSPLGGLP